MVGGLGQLGLMAQDGARLVFESIEQRSQLSMLVSGGTKNGHHVASEFHIDGFALGLILRDRIDEEGWPLVYALESEQPLQCTFDSTCGKRHRFHS